MGAQVGCKRMVTPSLLTPPIFSTGGGSIVSAATLDWQKGAKEGEKERMGYWKPTRYSKTAHFVIGRSRVQLSPSAPFISGLRPLILGPDRTDRSRRNEVPGEFCD